MPHANISSISPSVSKTFLASYLLVDSSDGTMELLKGEQLEHIHDKLCELSSPNVHNLVASLKHHSRGGYIDNILELKSKSQYDYIQECCFPGQVHGQKVFIFKMSINVVGTKVNLITQIQPIGDLQNVWVMFDHVKCVVGWTTMVCHVYDLVYCKVLTIMVCDM